MAYLEAKVVCLLITLMVGAAPHAEAAITCANVLTSLSSCINYFRNGGAPPPACCDAVKSIYRATSTPPARQALCRCTKSLVPSVGVNPVFLNSVGVKCGINIPYRYYPSIDCSKVH